MTKPSHLGPGIFVSIISGRTAKLADVGMILTISPSGKRLTVRRPGYAAPAVFYLVKSRGRYVESYGGISHLNDYLE